MPIARIQAFLMSLLSRQLSLTKDGFLARYPNCWLVWEPGEWSVPASGVDVSVAETRVPSTKAPERPLGGDALCFALKVPDGGSVRLGRSAENEIVVSDLTVSRLHARFEFKGGAWYLVPLSETKTTAVGGRVLPREQPVGVRSGEAIQLGGVTVTFYDSAAFKGRVAAAPSPRP